MKNVSLRVLQLNDSKESRNYMFTSLTTLKNECLKVRKELYNVVYSAATDFEGDVNDFLESMFVKFQGVKPEGYTGHSLSVSDMIEIDGVCYYVDDCDFVKMDF